MKMHILQGSVVTHFGSNGIYDSFITKILQTVQSN